MGKRKFGGLRDRRRRGVVDVEPVADVEPATDPDPVQYQSRRCIALNKYGEQCRNYTKTVSDLCHYHSSVWPVLALMNEWKALGGSNNADEFEAWAAERGFVVGTREELSRASSRLLTADDLSHEGWLR